MTESTEQTEGPRRSYGSGSLFVRRDRGGAESWYGRWYIGGRRVQRKLGPKHVRGTSDGLTRAQAERELRRQADAQTAFNPTGVAVKIAAQKYIDHLEHVLERKPSTISDYRSMLRRHIGPFSVNGGRVGLSQTTCSPTSSRRSARAWRARRSPTI